jgi:hypothetical protein
MEKRRKRGDEMEPGVGITFLTTLMLWIREERERINKGYPLWITFISVCGAESWRIRVTGFCI